MHFWSRLIEKCGLYSANKVQNSNFQYFKGKLLLCYWADFAHYRTHPRSCVYKYFVQLWSRPIEKCGLYCANKVKNSNFQYFRGNYSGVAGRISLIIELIRDLVAINTTSKFGPDWLRNVVSITLTRKELTDARMTDELPWHKPLWPLVSGAKNYKLTNSDVPFSVKRKKKKTA